MNKEYKNIKLKVKQSMVLLLGVLCMSCVETYDFESEIETYENALVIEATITNELKEQEIFLSRTYRLEEGGPSPERGATVKVVDNTNTEYLFRESDSAGVYVSNISFAAKNNFEYTLQITTNEGKEYNSTPMQLTQNTKMDSLYAYRDFNEDEVEGISIYVNSFDPTGKSKFYKYEYEESFKIIAPYWVEKDIVGSIWGDSTVVAEGYPVKLVDRPRDEQVCYKTVVSNTIITTSTTELEEDRLDKYRMRFISRDNYIISHRYTILVRQYVQSRAAHVYYETLKLFSESESLLSENQPGFLGGNMKSLTNANEKVLGYFEVSSVDEQRIYFNYEDFFPDELLPPYANGCLFVAPPLRYPPTGRLPLKEAVSTGNFKYFGPNTNLLLQPDFEGPVILVTKSCGDCTVLGKTEIPDFWIE